MCGNGERGCLGSNPTCNDTVLRRDNWFNTIYPRLEWGTFRPAAAGTGTYLGGLPKLWSPALWSFGPWAPGASAGAVPPGTTANSVPADRLRASRGVAATNAPGAYVAPPLAPPATPEFWLPTGQPYPIGTPANMRHVWVDPVNGNNANSGASRAAALRNLGTALASATPVRCGGPGGLPGRQPPATRCSNPALRSCFM